MAWAGLKPVTDANFLLGYLNPVFFAGESMAVDMGAAERAIAKLSGQLKLPSLQVAWGVHDIVDENMAGAARVHIAERGRDPRKYTLLCTGGSGPVHGYYVAKKLGLKQIICPPAAGVASAPGLLVAPARVDRVATVGLRLDDRDWPTLEKMFVRLEQEARCVLAGAEQQSGRVTVRRFVDARCVGQGFDLGVPVPPGPSDTGDSDATAEALTAAFVNAYQQRFGRKPLRAIMKPH